MSTPTQPTTPAFAAAGVTWRGTARQYGVLGLGSLLLAFGVALTIAAGLGVASWQVFETGIMDTTGASFAVVAVVESLIVLVIAWVWLKQLPGPATVLFAFAIGPLVGWLLTIVPDDLATVPALAQLAIGVVSLGMGVGLYVGAGLGASAQDSLFVGLFQRFNWRPRDARLLTDVLLVVGGWLLGGQVGVGTIVLTVGLPLIIEPGMHLGQRLAHSARR